MKFSPRRRSSGLGDTEGHMAAAIALAAVAIALREVALVLDEAA
jgi:hypothetical protein